MNRDELGLAKLLIRGFQPRPMTARPDVVQRTSTATSSAVSDFVRLRPVADLPQWPLATTLPGVRIEGTRPPSVQ